MSLWLQCMFYTLYGLDLSMAGLEEFPAYFRGIGSDAITFTT